MAGSLGFSVKVQIVLWKSGFSQGKTKGQQVKGKIVS